MSDLSFWGQSWWQGAGVVISAILAIIAIIVGIKQNRKKKLSYNVLFSEPLLNFDKKLQNDLNVTYKGQEVEQLNVFQIKFINDGKVPIRRDDFDEPIECLFYNCKTFFDIELTDSNPKNLRINVDQKDKRLIIQPTLINPNDSFTLRITFDGEDRKYNLSARIEGIEKLSVQANDVSDKVARTIFVAISAFTGILVVVFSNSLKDLIFLISIGATFSIGLPALHSMWYRKK